MDAFAMVRAHFSWQLAVCHICLTYSDYLPLDCGLWNRSKLASASVTQRVLQDGNGLRRGGRACVGGLGNEPAQRRRKEQEE
jgi:hypothetical protein